MGPQHLCPFPCTRRLGLECQDLQGGRRFVQSTQKEMRADERAEGEEGLGAGRRG